MILRGKGYKPVPRGTYKHPVNIAVPHIGSAKPKGAANNEWQVEGIVLDQGMLGSCVWHMIAEMVIADNRKDGDLDGFPSRLFGYYNTLSMQGDLPYDAGCNPATAMAAAAKYGFPRESLWPYDIDKFAKLPPSSAYREGYGHRGPLDLLWVQSTGSQKVDDVKILLDEGFVVGICGPVGPEYGNWKKGDAPLTPPPNYYPGNPEYGGHARLVTTYSGDTFRELGSWSRELGDGGYVCDDASLIEWPETDALCVFRKAPGVKV